MKAILIMLAVLLLIIGIIALNARNTGFTKDGITAAEQEIKNSLVNRMKNSPSSIERDQIESGSTTVEVHLIKVSDRKLEGFVTIKLRDESSQRLGLGELTIPCEAIMEVNSYKYVWKLKQ